MLEIGKVLLTNLEMNFLKQKRKEAALKVSIKNKKKNKKFQIQNKI